MFIDKKYVVFLIERRDCVEKVLLGLGCWFDFCNQCFAVIWYVSYRTRIKQ